MQRQLSFSDLSEAWARLGTLPDGTVQKQISSHTSPDYPWLPAPNSCKYKTVHILANANGENRIGQWYRRLGIVSRQRPFFTGSEFTCLTLQVQRGKHSTTPRRVTPLISRRQQSE